MTEINYEEVKRGLRMALMPVKGNSDLLTGTPHERIEDMALVVHLDVGLNKSLLVTNELLKSMGVSEEQIRHDAMEQTQNRHHLTIQTIEEALGFPLVDKAELDPMLLTDSVPIPRLFVASYEDSYLGAAVITFPDFMQKASEVTQGDFFVLPASRHEVLFMKDDGSQNVAELKDMVSSINASEVMPCDRLTNNVYHYDSKAKIFEAADKFENRKFIEEHNQSSVLKQLNQEKVAVGKAAHKQTTGRDNQMIL